MSARYQGRFNEHLQVIKGTKNVDTVIERFNMMKGDVLTLFQTAPPSWDFTVTLFEDEESMQIRTSDDVKHFDAVRDRFVRELLKDSIEAEIGKVALLRDEALKAAHSRAAIDLALKGLDHFPK